MQHLKRFQTRRDTAESSRPQPRSTARTNEPSGQPYERSALPVLPNPTDVAAQNPSATTGSMAPVPLPRSNLSPDRHSNAPRPRTDRPDSGHRHRFQSAPGSRTASTSPRAKCPPTGPSTCTFDPPALSNGLLPCPRIASEFQRVVAAYPFYRLQSRIALADPFAYNT